MSFENRRDEREEENRTRSSVSEQTENLVSKDDLEVILRPPILLGIQLRRILGLDGSKRNGVSRSGGVGSSLDVDVLLLDVLVGVNLIRSSCEA